MSLQDVSKMITTFQRQCRFAEWFTKVFRLPLVEALMTVFTRDLAEGQSPPDVVGMVDGLVLRLRNVLTALMGSETDLVAAIRHGRFLTRLRDKIALELRVLFIRARGVCRDHFGPEKADQVGFPARVADDYLALQRQTNVASFNLRDAGFDLGENLVPASNHNAETILGIYESKVTELEQALDDSVEQQAVIEGKQVKKDEDMDDFRTTYGIFVGLVKGCFRLAGLPEMADRLTLKPRRRPTSSATPGEGDPPASSGEPGSSDDPIVQEEIPEIPPEFAELVRIEEPTDE